MAPRNQSVPIRIVNMDTLLVTLRKNTKIATAELVSDETICSTSECNQSKTELEVYILLHPIPYDITAQKE